MNSENSESAGYSTKSAYSHYRSREIRIGNILIGNEQPVRIQSMTNTPTADVEATVDQAIRIFEAGAELVRITVPSMKEAGSLKKISGLLKSRGYDGPLVADVHFRAELAEEAARYVEKVRINPGNYTDKKKQGRLEFTEEEYQDGLNEIRSKLGSLIKVCREHRVALRIGTNHGSLSDRIMSRYGDTPEGMVEATLEFLRICRDEHFNDVVVSLKSSNTKMMIYANRLMVLRMIEEGMDFPLHLGVTEAGEGEDGRIRSAVGIGTLLADGIGDTIRVSLTESPEKEIPVAKDLAGIFAGGRQYEKVFPEIHLHTEYRKKPVRKNGITGSQALPLVICDLSEEREISPNHLEQAGYRFEPLSGKWVPGSIAADFIYTGNNVPAELIRSGIRIICNAGSGNHSGSGVFPLFNQNEFTGMKGKTAELNFVIVDAEEITGADLDKLMALSLLYPIMLIVSAKPHPGIRELRRFFGKMDQAACNIPVIIKKQYHEPGLSGFQVKSAAETGIFFIDGMADGLWLKNSGNSVSTGNINSASFGILQACRLRFTRTEFISCPSCGRTLFDIQKATAILRQKTTHLKNLKIAVMGCIVNGPGEMADADYGYVGAGPGKVSLYRGKEMVMRNIPEDAAVDQLLGIIMQDTGQK